MSWPKRKPNRITPKNEPKTVKIRLFISPIHHHHFESPSKGPSNGPSESVSEADVFEVVRQALTIMNKCKSHLQNVENVNILFAAW